MILEVLAAAPKGGGGGSSFLFIIVLALGALWLIVIRPQRRKQKAQQSMQRELAIGDEIVTAGGVYGTVTQIDDDEVRVEIAPNVEVRLARRAVAAHLTEPEPEPEDEAEAEPEAEHEAAENPDASDEHESGEKNPG